MTSENIERKVISEQNYITEIMQVLIERLGAFDFCTIYSVTFVETINLLKQIIEDILENGNNRQNN